MMKGWKQREANAVAKREAMQDPEKLAIREIQRAHLYAEEERHRLAAEAEREAREAPVRAVVDMLRAAFGPSLPDFAIALRGVGGLRPVAEYLEKLATKAITEERQARNDEYAASSEAASEAMSEQNRAERVVHAKTTEERRARQEAIIAERRATLAAGTASQDAPQAP